jgi:hypothetical protein
MTSLRDRMLVITASSITAVANATPASAQAAQGGFTLSHVELAQGPVTRGQVLVAMKTK